MSPDQILWIDKGKGMPHFIEISGLKDKCYVQIPDDVWGRRSELEKKQITEAVEKGFIADSPGGIGIKKNPRYHISIKSDFRLCAQLKAAFTSQSVSSATLDPYVSPYQGRTAATPGEQRNWYVKEVESKKEYDKSIHDVSVKFMLFDREKDHQTLSQA